MKGHGPGDLTDSSAGECEGEREPEVGSCPHRRMAQESGGNLSEVRARVGASHSITDLARKLQFYDGWAPDYDQVNPSGSLPPLARPDFSISKVGIPFHPRKAVEMETQVRTLQSCPLTDPCFL